VWGVLLWVLGVGWGERDLVVSIVGTNTLKEHPTHLV